MGSLNDWLKEIHKEKYFHNIQGFSILIPYFYIQIYSEISSSGHANILNGLMFTIQLQGVHTFPQHLCISHFSYLLA